DRALYRRADEGVLELHPDRTDQREQQREHHHHAEELLSKRPRRTDRERRLLDDRDPGELGEWKPEPARLEQWRAPDARRDRVAVLATDCDVRTDGPRRQQPL